VRTYMKRKRLQGTVYTNVAYHDIGSTGARIDEHSKANCVTLEGSWLEMPGTGLGKGFIHVEECIGSHQLFSDVLRIYPIFTGRDFHF
jgi:hypothetical protein